MGQFPNIDAAREYSDGVVNRIREALSKLDLPKDSISVACSGSFARREASPESDIDFFVIRKSDTDASKEAAALSRIKEAIYQIVPRAPAEGGAFGTFEVLSDIANNIGGDQDTNTKITKRILLLLEGEWLYGQEIFNETVEKLLGRYIQPTITDHQLCLFLLNDIIRYYRTICVDFEYKTFEAEKAWGVRNIKLIFSRKLLYFSGILPVAECFQRSYEYKLRHTLELLRLPPIQRVQKVCGAKADMALSFYDRFLGAMSNAGTRKMLNDIRSERPHHIEFRDLKDEGHHFSFQLMRLLSDTYGVAHPIYRGLML